MLAQPAVSIMAATKKARARQGRSPKSGRPPTRTDRRRLHLVGAGERAELKILLRRAGREEMHAARDDAGPAGLVARPEAGAVVAVEVLVEQHEVAPVR